MAHPARDATRRHLANRTKPVKLDSHPIEARRALRASNLPSQQWLGPPGWDIRLFRHFKHASHEPHRGRVRRPNRHPFCCSDPHRARSRFHQPVAIDPAGGPGDERHRPVVCGHGHRFWGRAERLDPGSAGQCGERRWAAGRRPEQPRKDRPRHRAQPLRHQWDAEFQPLPERLKPVLNGIARAFRLGQAGEYRRSAGSTIVAYPGAAQATPKGHPGAIIGYCWKVVSPG